MVLTTIQLTDETKKKLTQRKIHPRESYDEVIRRVLEEETFPTMEEMFKRADTMHLGKEYSREDIIRMTHEMRR